MTREEYIYVCEEDGDWFRRDPQIHTKPVWIKPVIFEGSLGLSHITRKVYKLKKIRAQCPLTDDVITEVIRRDIIKK